MLVALQIVNNYPMLYYTCDDVETTVPLCMKNLVKLSNSLVCCNEYKVIIDVHRSDNESYNKTNILKRVHVKVILLCVIHPEN